MSAFSDELTEEVGKTVTSAWSKREGKVIPSSESLNLGNDRVEMEAVLLYADLADSTELAIQNREIASEVCKAYLRGVTKIIKSNGGEIRSFDGDRVMGVFFEGGKNTAAVISGLQICWFFREVVSAKFKGYYTSALAGVTLNQTVGIDRSDMHVSRAGVRNDNDLIWVGRAPNIAAKLSGVRNGYNTLITSTVYNTMLDEAKYAGNPKRNMWSALRLDLDTKYALGGVYGSTWQWKP
jgi:adenylate cyclase